MDKIGKHLTRIAVEESVADQNRTFLPSGHKVGRNDKCLCGSQKKFKKCCRVKIQDWADELKRRREEDEG